MTKPSIPVNLVGPQVSLPLRWVPASRGVFIFLCVIRRHFLVCEDSWWVRPVSGGHVFFAKYRDPSGGSQMSGGGNHYFARNKEAFPCVWSWTQLSASPRTVHVRWKPFLDHVDHAAPRAPGRWTTARPRKGMTQSRGRHGSGCPRVEEYEGSLVRCGVRLPSPQNNRGCV